MLILPGIHRLHSSDMIDIDVNNFGVSAASANNVIFTQTLSLVRRLCWVAICYLICLLTDTSLFLLYPPPAPLLILDPVWRSCRLLSQLLVRPPSL